MIKGKESVQFLVNPDIGLIDGNVSEYVLCNESILRCDNEGVIGCNYEVLPDEFDISNHIKRRKEVSERTLKWIGIIGNKYNELFDLNLSERAWWFILRPFVLRIVNESVEKYAMYEYIKEKNIYIKSFEFNASYVTDMELARDLIYSVDLHSYMWSAIFEDKGKESIILKKKNGKEKLDGFRKIVSAAKLLKSNPMDFKKKIIELLSPKDTIYNFPEGKGEVLVVTGRLPENVVEGIVEKSEGKIEFFTSAAFANATLNDINSICIDEEFRKDFADFLKKFSYDAIDDIFIRLLYELCPKSMFEGVGVLAKKAKDLCENWNYRKIYHAYDETDFFRFCCGITAEKDALICDMQHAMGYEVNDFIALEEIEQYDRFLTWGWTYSGILKEKVRPIAMTRQIQMLSHKRNIQKKGKILFLSAGGMDYTIYKRGQYCACHARQLKEFIKNLSEETLERLVIRTNLSDKDSDIRIWCHKYYPCIKFERIQDKSLYESALESDFVISDNFGSAHIEALMIGIPFIMYAGIKNIEYSKREKAIINEMENIDIFSEDAKELAEIVNKNIQSNDWLTSVDKVDFYKRYLNLVTGLNKDISRAWMEEFLGD